MRAALIYQHATTDRDAAIATALSRLATRSDAPQEPAPPADRPQLRHSGRARPRAAGTQRARGAHPTRHEAEDEDEDEDEQAPGL